MCSFLGSAGTSGNSGNFGLSRGCYGVSAGDQIGQQFAVVDAEAAIPGQEYFPDLCGIDEALAEDLVVGV
jgi:hypothetical protein